MKIIEIKDNLDEIFSFFNNLSNLYEIYFLFKISPINIDHDKRIVKNFLISLSSKNTNIDSNKVVFYETSEGKYHIVRHIQPYLHIDNEYEPLLKLKLHIKKVIYIRDNLEGNLDNNIKSLNLKELFNMTLLNKSF